MLKRIPCKYHLHTLFIYKTDLLNTKCLAKHYISIKCTIFKILKYERERLNNGVFNIIFS